MYNDQYRKDKKSQYTFENICIVPGGRAGLSRVAAVVGDVYVSFRPTHMSQYRRWYLTISF
jgi:hypothetical protein